MTWEIRTNCAAAVLLLGLAGCPGTDSINLGLLQGGTPGGDRVVAGSLETVSQSAQGLLSELGLVAVSTREGEAIRVRARTPKGTTFSLVFTRAKDGDLERTRVQVEWENGREEQLAFQVLDGLEAARK